MARILIAIAVIVTALALWRWARAEYRRKGRPFAIKALLVTVAVILITLAATGRVHWIGAIAATLVAALRFALPLLIKSLPFLRSLQAAAATNENSAGQQHSQTVPSSDSQMTEAEAFAVLGLEPGASREDIIEAHRQLIQKLHPDRGGNKFLATQLNHARDTLLS